MKLDGVELLKDYVVSMIVFGSDGDIYRIKAFKNALIDFEVDGDSPQDKLGLLLNKTVKIEANKNTYPEKEALLVKLCLINK